MLSRNLLICNKLGLHARAAARLVETASSFTSSITVDKAGHRVDAKSILGVMMLAAAKGSEITIEATGDDAADALDALEALVNDRFGENE